MGEGREGGLKKWRTDYWDTMRFQITDFVAVRGNWCHGSIFRQAGEKDQSWGLLWLVVICYIVTGCLYVKFTPAHLSSITALNCQLLSKARHDSVFALLFKMSGERACGDSSHGRRQQQRRCSTYSKQLPTAHFYSFSCSSPAKLCTYSHRQALLGWVVFQPFSLRAN